jgi:AcrR family transcriptional regulator
MTSSLPLTERNRRRARQRIVRAAEELFLARGFDDVSVSDIAERAEVGRTTFFRHFRDKQEVVFAKEQELLEMITAAELVGDTAALDAAGALKQVRPIVLALCAQATADPEGYTRHFQLVEQHPELGARDAVKMQLIADKLSDLLIQRGGDRTTAVFAGQIALACYWIARRLGNNPHTLVDETRAAFERVLTAGT